MARTTRARLTEVRARTATADEAKHERQLFDGLGSNGLYLHVAPAGAKCCVHQFMVPKVDNRKSRHVRIGCGHLALSHACRCACASVHASF